MAAQENDVKILSWPELDLGAKRDFPLCLKICEPICATSRYVISIDIFDRPVALIKLEGETRLEACTKESPPVRIS